MILNCQKVDGGDGGLFIKCDTENVLKENKY